MFTGIIETVGTLVSIDQENSNFHFTVSSSISDELHIDQSVAHSGVCLTVTSCGNGRHVVTAIDETMRKTNLGDLRVGDAVNLERCMPAHGRFDGHIVQGHVDTTGICAQVEETAGSWKYVFTYPESAGQITVPKGSITINGVSLTVVDSEPTGFSVAIIPYTYEHTTFKTLQPGDRVNLEFDVIGKYVQAYLTRSGQV